MQFILIAHDKAGALPLRMATRPAHLDYCQRTLGKNLVFGGPLLAADGNPRGSILVVEAADEAEARRLFENDPYRSVGLFEDVTISGFRQVFSNGAQV